MKKFIRLLLVSSALGSVAFVALLARGTLQLHATPTFKVNRVPASTRSIFPHPLFGVVLKNAPYQGVERVEQQAGKHLGIIEIGQPFDQPLDVRALSIIHAHGSLPMLTWYPWTKAYSLHGGSKAPLEAYSLRRIYSGSFDDYIRQEARGVAKFHHPIILRLAPEMNGFWYPWAESPTGNVRGEFRNSNQLGEYVRMWRHVHDLFEQEGASNVVWNWSPNIWYWGQKYGFDEYWPGDRYVDLVGVDGYNWGTAADWSKWFTPGQVFSKTLTILRRLSNRPVLLSETASTEKGGNKAVWIRQFFQFLAQNPDIAGFCWFDYRKETHWSIASSQEALLAFHRGVQRASSDPNTLLVYLKRGTREVARRDSSGEDSERLEHARAVGEPRSNG